ncbi:MotA/TolQ/ExbB proton channel [uncultured Desulfobacterium sp.]|uniref:MotA/TolQ/ExbB proton channel n=1 Tax=uncultured Desulfobacterium sp. TaxID=201089 RepID=A0A445N1B1_9BACT|nr:MotA/TolQ/ExbB proton channel [uncultured Desulfobacterium sp.]
MNEGEREENMLEFLVKGGICMWPILLCSVVGLAIFLERFIRFGRMLKRGKNLEIRVTEKLKINNDEEALQIASRSNSPVGRVLVKALEVKDQDRDTIETVIVHATEEEVQDLSRYLQALATIGNVAPMLGLLGTVLGMIKAFMVIQEMGGKVNAAVLAGGIWEAMLTTAFGLAVALPIVVGHSYLLSRVDSYEARIQQGTVVFLKTLSSLRNER